MPNAFAAYLAEHHTDLDGYLASFFGEERTGCPAGDDLDRFLYAPLRAFSENGGKRHRPLICLIACRAVGGDPARARSCAAAIEHFQSAALIHDDIADEGELRRGEPCLHRAEGTGLAINAGDLALTQVFEVVLRDEALPADRRLRALSELVRMERHTLEGQALDLGWVRDARWDVTSEDYLYMVTSKTSWYSAAVPLYVGALVGGGSEEAARGLLEVGLTAGVAFQLADDLLNLVGDAEAQGKDFRSDITEGKRTLAAVWALEHLDDVGREELVALLGSSTTDAAALARAVELIDRGGGIEHCRTLAGQMAERAKEGARELAEAGHITVEARDLLLSMSDFFVERAS